MSDGATQPASGMYTELGVGVLPGRGRPSVSVGGGRSVLPFPRNPELSDDTEPVLSAFMSTVSALLHAVLPAGTLQDHSIGEGCPLARCHRTRKTRRPSSWSG